MLARVVVVVLALSMTAGCNSLTNKESGTLLGGAVGGLLGSTIGDGDGQVAAAVAGALIGAFVGSNIGESMDELDRVRMSRALENSPTGKTAAWVNPDSGTRYEVTPTRTYQRDAATPCREFTTEAWIDGRRETLRGQACRQADGTWKVI